MASDSDDVTRPSTGGYRYNLGLAFYRVAREHARDTALRYPGGDAVEFKALNSLSNRIARAFVDKGVGKGDVVCIFNNKSVSAFASMIACLKIGAPYTNLDVSSPPERISKMLATCEPALLLFDRLPESAGAFGSVGFDGQAYDLSSPEFTALVDNQADDDLAQSQDVTGADPAYIMFTSGSTGFPKGAVMSHDNVLNFIGWARATFGIAPSDVLTNVNPIYFDNSVFDFYSSLFSGGTLCPIRADIVEEPRKLVQTINQLGCTIWFSVPSLLVYLLTLRAIGAGDFASVTRVIFGGEGFPKGKLRELYDLLKGRARLINVYGPTECTCICSAYPITQNDVDDQSKLAPLGKMAPNFGFRIDPTDESNRAFGELLITGPNVGLGYYNDQGLTAQAFVEDPEEGRYRSIVYRTGDLVELDANGDLHFRGRADNQIKHMGYRIELEEIEAAFNTLSYVDEVAVVYRKSPDDSGKIVAFVGCLEQKPVCEMQDDVKKSLPPYMIPKEIKLMATLPKNANGKIDRTRLKSMD